MGLEAKRTRGETTTNPGFFERQPAGPAPALQRPTPPAPTKRVDGAGPRPGRPARPNSRPVNTTGHLLLAFPRWERITDTQAPLLSAGAALGGVLATLWWTHRSETRRRAEDRSRTAESARLDWTQNRVRTELVAVLGQLETTLDAARDVIAVKQGQSPADGVPRELDVMIPAAARETTMLWRALGALDIVGSPAVVTVAARMAERIPRLRHAIKGAVGRGCRPRVQDGGRHASRSRVRVGGRGACRARPARVGWRPASFGWYAVSDAGASPAGRNGRGDVVTNGALVALSWTRLTGTQVGVFGSLTGVAIAVATLLVGHRNEARRAAQALETERLRIVAAREVEELRIAAALEVDTRGWVRNELRTALVEVFAGVDRMLDAWREAAVTRDAWLVAFRSDSALQPSAETLERAGTSRNAWGGGGRPVGCARPEPDRVGAGGLTGDSGGGGGASPVVRLDAAPPARPVPC